MVFAQVEVDVNEADHVSQVQYTQVDVTITEAYVIVNPVGEGPTVRYTPDQVAGLTLTK